MTEASSVRGRPPQNALGAALREQFALNVRVFREQKGMSQGDLARAASVGREFINRIERGHFTVNLERLGAIAVALGVSPAELIATRPLASYRVNEPMGDQVLAA